MTASGGKSLKHLEAAEAAAKAEARKQDAARRKRGEAPVEAGARAAAAEAAVAAALARVEGKRHYDPTFAHFLAVNAAMCSLVFSYMAFCLFYVAAFAIAQPAGRVGVAVVGNWARAIAVSVVTFPAADLFGVFSRAVVPAAVLQLAELPACENLCGMLRGLLLGEFRGVLGAFEGSLSGRLGM